MVGVGMCVWRATPLMVDTLFDIGLLRGPIQMIPAAPANTTWTPGTKTLSTTALPNWATRLELWRQAPGGMPEQLAIGPVEALFVQVPVGITFATGVTYQLWLQARNSRGGERPGPEADVDGGVAGDGDEVWGLGSEVEILSLIRYPASRTVSSLSSILKSLHPYAE